MFRKTRLSIAAAVSMTAGAAFAQMGPQQGPYQPYPQQPQSQYPQYSQYPQPQYPQQQPQNGGYGQGKLDLTTAQPRQSQAYRYMLPQGWQVAEQPGICMTVSPDMTMAVGIIAPGQMSGQLSAEQYMKNVLTNVGQFQNINVQNAQRMQPQAPFTEAGTYMISYTVMGQQFMGVVNSAVAQQNGQTWGFVQMVLGTQQQLQVNGRELVQLSQAMAPINQPNAGPTPTLGPSPEPTPMPTYGEPVAPQPGPAPAPAPASNNGGDWNWGRLSSSFTEEFDGVGAKSADAVFVVPAEC